MRISNANGISRRSFFWKLGAGASAGLASTVGMARAGKGDEDDPALRAALLEAEKALRELHQAFELAMDKGLHEVVIGMFADDAEVVFNGQTYRRRDQGLTRLFRENFQAGKSGKRMKPAPGFELAAGQQQDRVEVAADRLSATAVFPYSIQVGMPIESVTSLASMARLHDEGVRTWWEGGAYQANYTMDVAEGRWKIRRLEYNTLSRADYRPGRSYASAMPESPLAARDLEELHGPEVRA